MEGRALRGAVITGATGMIGAALTSLLLERGVRVIALVHPGSKKRGNLPAEHPMLTIVEAGLENLKDLEPQSSADAFFHLAWSGTYGDARNDYDLQLKNVAYTLDAVRLAERYGCTVFVGAGSQAEYGKPKDVLAPDSPVNPETGYGIAKLAAGQMSRGECHKYGMVQVWTRFFSVYGPGDNAYTMVMSGINQMLDGKRPAYTAGDQLWDYLYCRDAAKAMLLCAEYGTDGSVYCVGSGKVRPLAEYIEAIRAAVGPQAQVGLGERPYFPGQVMHLQADISTLTRDTGFVPETDFEEGIRRTVAWAKEQRK